MGLDTYAVYPNDDDNDRGDFVPDDIFSGINLCGGMFSGGGSSFRGKVYSETIEHITGVNLYSESYISSSRVKDMAHMLKKHVNRVGRDNVGDDVINIYKWFKIAGKNGFAIYNWR
jgi:hypothetical protein